MDKNKYFQKMRETSAVVDPVIRRAIKSIEYLSPSLHEFVANIPPVKKRLEKKQAFRSFLLRMCYEVCGGANWKEILPACAAVDLLNISTYVDNAVFDNKNGINLEKDRNNYIITGRILRDKSSEILRESNSKSIGKLEHLLEGIDQQLYSFQFIDLQPNLDSLAISSDEFLKTYEVHCYLLTGIFMENIARMGGVLANASQDHIDALGEYGKHIGIMDQIINDLADFIPFDCNARDYEKVYQDQFSDVKQSKVTLPLHYAWGHGSNENKKSISKVLGNISSSNQELESLLDIILLTGGADYTKNLAKQHGVLAKEYLHVFDKCEARDYLSTASSMWSTNKYFVALKYYEEGLKCRST